MSTENTIKKRKLEELKEEPELEENIIEIEAEKFLEIFNKIFIEQSIDCEDSAATDAAAKVISKIKEKIDYAFSKNIVGKLIKLILELVKICLKDGESKTDLT